MHTIRHPDPVLSIGFEIVSLQDQAAQISSCASVPRQKFPSHMPRANAYVTLSFPDVPFRLILRIPPHITQRNASARERRRPIMKRPTASSSRPPNTTVAQQSSGAAQSQSSSQAHAAVSTSTAPPVVANTTSNTNPHATIKHAGRWARFWLFICCTSPEYTDGHH
jgi:hypothetical protein